MSISPAPTPGSDTNQISSPPPTSGSDTNQISSPPLPHRHLQLEVREGMSISPAPTPGSDTNQISSPPPTSGSDTNQISSPPPTPGSVVNTNQISPPALTPGSHFTSDGSSSSSTSSSAGVGIGIGVAVAIILVIVAGFLLIRRRKRRMAALEGQEGQQSQFNPSATPPSNIDYLEVSSHAGPRSFSYEQLRIATNNFSKSELLGAGGFGSVYRGMLANDSTHVAVKCIAENSNQGAKEYKAEVTIISDLRHRNLVRLRGWCQHQGKFLIVYDYMPNGSLDYLLFNDKLCSKLSWERRYSIASGLGSALQYLHEECENVIIHRDIKSSNVLLDESFNAKLGDFGLSRQVDQGITSLTTTVAGTHGYMAPECLFGPRKATRETDVYAFGAVLLELVCGKRAAWGLPEQEGVLVDWVWHLHSQGKVMEAVDKRLEGRYDNEEARRMLVVGLLCSNPDPKARPKIKRALDVLVGSVPLPSVPSSKPIMTFGPPPPMSMTQILEDSSITNSTSSSSTQPLSAASSDYVQRLR